MHKRMVSLSMAAIFLWPAAVVEARGDDSAEFARLMNHGKALLENRESVKAIETIRAVLKIKPDSTAGLRNLARACLIADKMDDAITAVTRVVELEPRHAAGHYLWGLALVHQTKFEEAVPKFEEAARLDAATPAVRFQLALAYQAAGRDKEALTQFKETARLDPLHAAAWFKLATYARQAGDSAEAQRCTREFTRLRKFFGDTGRNAGTLEACVHTKAEAVGVDATTQRSESGTTTEVTVQFSDDSKSVFSEKKHGASAVTVLSVDESGRPNCVFIEGDGTVWTTRMNENGKFVRKSGELKLSLTGGPLSLVVGDFFDDVPKVTKYDAKIHALNDVLVLKSDGIRLLRQVSAGTFADETNRAGLDKVVANDAIWADTDHDGDLDLALAKNEGPELWQNNGNGTFKNASAEAALPRFDRCIGVTACDLERDDATDLIFSRGSAPTIVVKNQRAGLFARMAEPPGPWSKANSVACDDLNHDGRLDFVLCGDESTEILFGQSSERVQLEHSGLVCTGAAFLDWNNDGRLELALIGSPRGSEGITLRAFQRDPDGRWRDNTEALGILQLGRGEIHSLIPADFDRDGDTDLLVHDASGSLQYLRNDGGNANRQLKLRLLSQKTNPSCYGTQVEVRAGNFFTSRRVDSPIVEIGVGRHEKLDTVQTVWTNGVVDNQLDVSVTKEPVAILEKNVATGSCPFLYAWDGNRFQFVTDILGNAPIGLPLRRDFLLPADPEEIVVIGEELWLKPKDGRFLFDVTSEFLEVLYLDEARLLAVDHPPGVEVHVNDKIMAPPFPTSEVWLLKTPRVPMSAAGDDGIDRTAALRATDRDFAPPGPLLPPPYRGMCHPLVITMDFGEVSGVGDPVLALTGWLQYGQASTNIALSQNPDAVVIMPRLEVETAPGEWRAVDVDVGMPAGKTKTILVDLKGKLPETFSRLRLTNTFEIRWDRIALCQRIPAPQSIVQSLRPLKAELRWRGFSEIRSRAENHPTTPDYENVSPKPPWRSSLEGWCTRYGDVVELTADRDNQLAIINGGDALRLEFDAAGFPSLQDGLRRTYLFYSYGWEKDGDYNVVEGDQVGTTLEAGFTEATIKLNSRWADRDQFRD